jgi:hypothetical protein
MTPAIADLLWSVDFYPPSPPLPTDPQLAIERSYLERKREQLRYRLLEVENELRGIERKAT